MELRGRRRARSPSSSNNTETPPWRRRDRLPPSTSPSERLLYEAPTGDDGTHGSRYWELLDGLAPTTNAEAATGGSSGHSELQQLLNEDAAAWDRGGPSPPRSVKSEIHSDAPIDESGIHSGSPLDGDDVKSEVKSESLSGDPSFDVNSEDGGPIADADVKSEVLSGDPIDEADCKSETEESLSGDPYRTVVSVFVMHSTTLSASVTDNDISQLLFKRIEERATVRSYQLYADELFLRVNTEPQAYRLVSRLNDVHMMGNTVALRWQVFAILTL